MNTEETLVNETFVRAEREAQRMESLKDKARYVSFWIACSLLRKAVALNPSSKHFVEERISFFNKKLWS